MENIQPTNPRQFLIRLWPEDLGNGEVEWRGKAQDLATGDSSYFRDWPGLVAAVQRMLEDQSKQLASPGTSFVEPGDPGKSTAEPPGDLSE